jgi:hypothetical protein
MKLTRAFEILRIYNSWRRGQDKRTLDQLGITNAEIGLAIETACEVLRQQIKL